MAAYATIVLDTTAPRITWRTPNVNPGQQFDVAYTLDEPQITSAELTDGVSQYPVNVSSTDISGVMPHEVNQLRLQVDVLDQVGNRASYQLDLQYRVGRAIATILDRVKTMLKIDDRPSS